MKARLSVTPQARVMIYWQGGKCILAVEECTYCHVDTELEIELTRNQLAALAHTAAIALREVETGADGRTQERLSVPPRVTA